MSAGAAAPLAPFDTDALKARTDLLAMIGRDTPLRKAATTRGGEWAGPCPFCGGRDRLRVQPEQGLWWCRQCSGDRWQDAIAYVQVRDGVPFAEACEILGGRREAAPRRAARLAAPIGPTLEPSDAWRRRGLAFARACERSLWADGGRAARDYLHGRGLTDATLRCWRLGWHPGTAFEDRAAWGLDPAADDRKRVCLSRGWVIPWFVGGELWALKIRRPDADLDGERPVRYVAVAGSRPYLFGADTLQGRTAAVLTEGELDAALLHQEVGDLVGVATLGGARKRLDPRALAHFLPIGTILLAHDADPAGDEGAAALLRECDRMRRAAPPSGKDVTEFHQAGGDLRAWVRFELERHLPQVAPLASEPSTMQPPATASQPDGARYALRIVWAEARGWLRVRDPFTGEWHELPARECPRSWIPRRAS